MLHLARRYDVVDSSEDGIGCRASGGATINHQSSGHHENELTIKMFKLRSVASGCLNGRDHGANKHKYRSNLLAFNELSFYVRTLFLSLI